MSSAVSRLLEEHQLIRKFSSALQWLSIRLGSNSSVDEDFVDATFKFLDFISGCHHEREEAIVFPALRGVAQDLVKEAIEEHRLFLQLSNDLKGAMSDGDLAKASDVAARISSLLLNHIQWEEAGLLAMAEASLPDELKDEISRELSAPREGCSTEEAERHLETIISAMSGG
ncbi:MAG: hemerythrin domain-containing protein [Acidilobus sp.]